MPITVRNDVSPYVLGPLAYQSGLGEFGMRQADRMQQAQLAYDQMANQQAMQANQIAAQQQSMMFQHRAGQEDAYQRAMMGEWQNQNQFARQQHGDQQNFQQQGQMAEWQAALQDRSWKNKLNAEGKQKEANWMRNKSIVEGYKDKLTPQQFDQAMGMVNMEYMNIKGDPNLFVSDPPSNEEWAKDSIYEISNKGLTVIKQEDGKRTVVQSGLEKLRQADATRIANLEKELANNIQIEEMKLKAKQQEARNHVYKQEDDADQKRREYFIKRRDKLIKPDKEGNALSEESAAKQAEADASMVHPDMRAARESFERDYDAYWKAVGGTDQYSNAPLPEDFADITNPRDARQIRDEVQAWKEKYGPKQAVQQQQPPTPSGPPSQQQPVRIPDHGTEFVQGTGVAPPLRWADTLPGGDNIRDTSIRPPMANLGEVDMSPPNPMEAAKHNAEIKLKEDAARVPLTKETIADYEAQLDRIMKTYPKKKEMPPEIRARMEALAIIIERLMRERATRGS